MISVTETKRILQQHTLLRPVESRPLGQSAGAVIATDVRSPFDIPSFDNSAMDGYALRLNTSLPNYQLNGVIPAGVINHSPLQDGQAVRIFTGAPIPSGTDTVVPQELVEIRGDSISFDQQATTRGAHIRLKGAQCRQGDLLVKKGTLIHPGIVSLLASAGMSDILVYAPPSVALIVSGNEVMATGNQRSAAAVQDANGPALLSYLYALSVSKVDLYHVNDDRQELTLLVEKVLKTHDMLVITGGISAGDYDYTRLSLQDNGVRELVHKIRQKPGKPMFAGTLGSKWVFALPGNPAAAITCFNQYVKPCIRQMMGFTDAWSSQTAALEEDYFKKSGLTHFLKGSASHGKVHITAGQESFNLLPFAEANFIVEIPEKTESLQKGAVVNIYPWN